MESGGRLRVVRLAIRLALSLMAIWADGKHGRRRFLKEIIGVCLPESYGVAMAHVV